MAGCFYFWVVLDRGISGKVFIFPDGGFFENAGGNKLPLTPSLIKRGKGEFIRFFVGLMNSFKKNSEIFLSKETEP